MSHSLDTVFVRNSTKCRVSGAPGITSDSGDGTSPVFSSGESIASVAQTLKPGPSPIKLAAYFSGTLRF